ncbi:MAG: WXG100 family type VII secretion target [Hamadaea sp.]|uniref:WXG100 family type VII secretion target n=1 Tax=Hamadaea sp. TaxID=2024425 RepID=UPI0017A41A9F|nr:WXG100 family type VII secretion target [Hamadaea sp.]NUR74387.1 WXG100 family type VII secretion target [Hamadaea sp.]NUT21572.1 WXG100 family type VII secretion target [Hamadaea sp.]
MARSEAGAMRIDGWLSPAGAALHIIKPIVDFLSHPLDQVTGDPEGLRAKAEAWKHAATAVSGLITQESDARAKLIAAWEGDAAKAFDKEIGELSTNLAEIVEHFKGTAEMLEQTATGAQQAEDLVVDIIKELIAWLICTIIVALASSWITLGASVAAGTAAGWAESAVAAGRCATVASKLAKLLRAAEKFLKTMSDFAKAYKITKLKSTGVSAWTKARFATGTGYQLIATNWVIKKTIVEPTVGNHVVRPTIGAGDKSIDWPALL